MSKHSMANTTTATTPPITAWSTALMEPSSPARESVGSRREQGCSAHYQAPGGPGTPPPGSEAPFSKGENNPDGSSHMKEETDLSGAALAFPPHRQFRYKQHRSANARGQAGGAGAEETACPVLTWCWHSLCPAAGPPKEVNPPD